MSKNKKVNKNISWIVPEYETHERSKNWYILSSITALLLLLFAFFTANFLFAVIIIISAIVIILNDGQNPGKVRIILSDEGISIGKKFYDYDELDNFSIIFKPKAGIKNLYFEFKSAIRHRISIHLEKTDPLLVREYLLKYLTEDLERKDQPLSENLAKIFKI